MLMTVGIRNSFGVVFKSLEGEFGLSRGATSAIFSVAMLLCCVFGVLGGWALDRYGARISAFVMGFLTGLSLILTSQANSVWQLYITYSLFLSLGTAAVFAVVNSTVSRWFTKKRGFALGIANSGGAVGLVILAPFTTYLISSFDWRTAFIILGIIVWLITACMSVLLKRDPRDMGLLPDGAKTEVAKTDLQTNKSSTQPAGLSLMEAFRTGNFWFIGFLWLLLSISVQLIMIHTVPHAIDMGISPSEAAFVLSLLGLAAIAGRLVAGRVSDKIGRKIPAIACALLQVGILIWLIWIRDLWMLYIFGILFGFSWGGIGNQIPALIGDIFGLRSIGAITGTLLIGWNLGGAIGPAIGGFMFDISGSYFTSFVTAAVSMLIATLLVALIRKGMDVERS